MALERIYSLDGIKALQACCEEGMLVSLVSLESVHKARESYALLRQLMELRRSWICPQLDLLSTVAGMALELHRIKHDLLPKLELGDLETLLLVKHSAMTLLCLGKGLKEEVGRSLVSARAKELGVLLKEGAVRVLKGTRNYVFVQEHVLALIELVDALLDTPVKFR